MEWQRDDFLISTDAAKLDLAVVHGFLSTTYWSKGVSRDIVARSLAHSLSFGVYHENRQIGLARVITDWATFGYIADVFIMEAYRGRGLAKWLLECILTHPELQTLRRFLLATQDAHGLYAQFGFRPLAHPEHHLERRPPGWQEPSPGKPPPAREAEDPKR